MKALPESLNDGEIIRLSHYVNDIFYKEMSNYHTKTSCYACRS